VHYQGGLIACVELPQLLPLQRLGSC
jgi:hypothetical protein